MATSTLVIVARKKTFGNIETNENSKNNKNGKKSENLGTNFIQIPYI